MTDHLPHAMHATSEKALSQRFSWRVPGEAYISSLLQRFSAFERAVFALFAILLVIGTFMALASLREQVTVPVPAEGGSFTEGIIGSPRFINPVLALSETDRDMTALLFAGLLRADPEKGLVPDVAERYEVSEDGTTYTFVLRDDAYFHDGHPVTADDVLFTIALVQENTLKSPEQADWDGVRIDKINDRELTITLPTPFAPFIENATLGILPQHHWEGLTIQEVPFSDLNTEPVGAGPFRVDRIVKSADGIPTEYKLARHRGYTRGTPYLHTITVRFFSGVSDLERAWQTGQIDGVSSLSATQYDRSIEYTLHRGTFPRVFAVFFNQDRLDSLRTLAVRSALRSSIDTTALISATLDGFGTPIDSPLLKETVVEEDAAPLTERFAEARNTLEEAGWEYNEETARYENDGVPLVFTLATANVPELKSVAEYVAAQWNELGADVSIAVFEPADLQQSVIRPRDYDALLFGEAVGREPDLFAFWHSSQREDPGLNVALYANSTADTLLAQARTTVGRTTRTELYMEFEQEIQKDIPAVFLYTPDALYGTDADVQGITLGTINTQSERFGNVHEWHRHTERVWTFLSSYFN